MEITYTEKQIWRKPVVEQPESLYTKKINKRVRSTLNRTAELDITHTLEPLSVFFLEWFSPLYVELIGKKKNANIHDLYAKTLGSNNQTYEYWALTVSMGTVRVGGAVILIKDDLLMIAYRAFIPKWPQGTLQASPSLYAEYIIAKTAFNLGKKTISHGKDRNLYGLNSSIGQLVYKLSVGYLPQLPVNPENEPLTILTLNPNDLTEDAVILHYPIASDRITQATLVTTQEGEGLYSQLINCNEQFEVDVVYRD